MKKYLSFFLIVVLAIFMVACSNKDDSAKNKDKQGAKKEEVTITYANWNLGTEEENNIERRMIQAFQEKYPHIKIKIDESIDTQDWNGSLSTAASAGKMPDVFMMSSLPLAISNDWVMDITSLVEKDEEYKNVPEVVRQSIVFDGKILAIPFAQHFLGYYVNKDVFNAANLDYPDYGVTVEEFAKAIKAVTNVNKGVVGLQNVDNIPDWYPAAVNKDMGWFTYKDGRYSLNSNEFISAINYAKDLFTNGYTYFSLTDEQKANLNAENDNDAWLKGGIAVKWDGTWAISNLQQNANFEFDFIGLPGGITAITNDLVGISKSTKHPEEAYLFAKWMSFGKEGFLKRLEIADEMGINVNTLPINSDQEILDEYFARLDIPGLKKAYENLDKAILEPFKTVPGFIDSRFEGETGVKVGDMENAKAKDLIQSFIRGELKVEDYAAQLDQLANAKYQEVLNSMKK